MGAETLTADSPAVSEPTPAVESPVSQIPASFEAHESVTSPMPESLNYLQEKPDLPPLESSADTTPVATLDSSAVHTTMTTGSGTVEVNPFGAPQNGEAKAPGTPEDPLVQAKAAWEAGMSDEQKQRRARIEELQGQLSEGKAAVESAQPQTAAEGETRTEARVSTLETQVTNLQQQVEALAPKETGNGEKIHPMRRLGRVIGTLLGKMENKWGDVKDAAAESPPAKYVKRLEQAVEAFKTVMAGKEAATEIFDVQNGKVVRKEGITTEAAKAEEAVAEEVPTEKAVEENPAESPAQEKQLKSVLLQKPFAELTTSELEQVQAHLSKKIGNIKEAIQRQEKAGDFSAELNKLTLQDVEGDLATVQAALEKAKEGEQKWDFTQEGQLDQYIQERLKEKLKEQEAGSAEKSTEGGEAFEFVTQLEGFCEKYNLSESFKQAVLAERLGENVAEELKQLHKDLDTLGVSSELKQQAVEEFLNAKAKKAAESSQSEATPENAGTENGKEGENQGIELQELIQNYKGYTETNVGAPTQSAELGREYSRLSHLLEDSPSLPRQYKSESIQTDQTGKEIKLESLFNYDGDLEGKEAISAAMADIRLKQEISAALEFAQRQPVEDKLDAFKERVGERVGNKDMVTLRRSESAKDVKDFVPGEMTLLTSYEKGQLILEVRPIDGVEKKAVTNTYQSAFEFHKKEKK